MIKELTISKFNKAFFIISIIFSLIMLIFYMNYPILEQHSFRQTQTAISSYYIMNSLSLNSIINYETPILGYPWAIPFEFPIYQTICALFCKCSHLSLDASGRIVSWIFMALCLLPLHFLSKKITKDKNLFYVIGSLYILSPLYVFWGKSFMIETCTLFWGMMFFASFVNYLDKKNIKSLFGIIVFAILCGLSKITTILGFVFLCFVYFLYKLKKHKVKLNDFIILLFSALISLSVCLSWIKYTDYLKTLNPYGVFLTSKSLGTWNYGTLAQRLSSEYYNIIFYRMNDDILGSFIIFIIGIICLFFIQKKYRKIALVFILTFFIPVLIFSNLHIIHNYYQTANAIFMLIGFGIICYGLMKKNKAAYVLLMLSTFIMMGIHTVQNNKYYVNANNSSIIKVCDFIKQNTPKNSAIVVLGIDWTSEVNYYSERKGVAIPNWAEEIRPALLSNADKIYGNLPIGAFAVKTNLNKQDEAFKKKFINEHKPKRKETMNDWEVYYEF